MDAKGNVKSTQSVESVKKIEQTQSAEAAKKMEQLQSIEPAKKVEQLQSIEPLQSTEAMRKVKQTQSKEEAKKAEPIQNVEAAKKIEQTQSVESVKKIEPVKKVEQTQSKEETKKIEPMKSIEAAKKIEPVQSTEAVKKVEQTQSKKETKKVEPMLSIEAAKKIEPLKKIEPMQSIEPAKKMEQLQSIEPAKKMEQLQSIEPAKKIEQMQSIESMQSIEAMQSMEAMQNMETKNEWDYHQNGPSTWMEKFPMAAGSRQSPVNIETDRAESDHEALSSKPLRWKYPATASRKLVNPGYCWRIDTDGDGTFLSGGPLMDDVYKLEQYHCHWGCSDSRGSEHTVDGQAFAGELHLVHWNTSKYSTFAEAAKASDGLAVLGVFLKVGKTHEEMDKIARLLPYVSHKDEVVEIVDPIDPGKLLPVRSGRAGTQRCINPCMRWADRIIRHDSKLNLHDDNGYWTYLGSLTTPPCNESVTWILFKKYIEVSHHQLNIFRNLRKFPRGEECPCHENHGAVINNFRPPLPLGNRVLRECGSF